MSLETKNPYHDQKVTHPYHWRRVEELARGEIPAPSNVEIDLTDEGCNQSCIHCCFRSGRGQKVRMIDEEQLIAFTRDVYEAGTSAFELVGGGEPTNHRAIGQIIDRISDFSHTGDHPAKVGLVTNGVLLHRVFDQAAQGKINWTRISLDSADPEMYEFLHGVQGKNQFNKVVDNIKTMTTLMPARDVGIGYLVVPPFNYRYEDILAGAAMAVELGVGHIGFRPAELDNQIIEPEMWQEAQAGIAEAKRKYGSLVKATTGSWGFVTGQQERQTKNCLTRPLVMVIKANGDLASCFLFRNENRNGIHRPPIGNIREGYQKAWLSEDHHQSLVAVNRNECPTPCKLDRTNETAESIIFNGASYEPTEDILHPEFI